MRSRKFHDDCIRIGWGVLALLAACLLCSCASSGKKRTAQIEFQHDGGFTVTDSARVSSSVRGDFKKALRSIEEEDYERGIELLEKVTEAAPHATTAHIDLGIAHRLKGNFEMAEASIQTALDLNPRHPVAYNELGIVYRKMGRFQEARKSYEGALEISSDFHFARRNLAILCDVYLGDMACAIEHYERYAQSMPEDAKVSMWLADLRNRTEE
jgi:Flp pilus assembly protein TadD